MLVCVLWVGLRNVRVSVLVETTTLVRGEPVNSVSVFVTVDVTITVATACTVLL